MLSLNKCGALWVLPAMTKSHTSSPAVPPSGPTAFPSATSRILPIQATPSYTKENKRPQDRQGIQMCKERWKERRRKRVGLEWILCELSYFLHLILVTLVIFGPGPDSLDSPFDLLLHLCSLHVKHWNLSDILSSRTHEESCQGNRTLLFGYNYSWVIPLVELDLRFYPTPPP